MCVTRQNAVHISRLNLAAFACCKTGLCQHLHNANNFSCSSFSASIESHGNLPSCLGVKLYNLNIAGTKPLFIWNCYSGVGLRKTNNPPGNHVHVHVVFLLICKAWAWAAWLIVALKCRNCCCSSVIVFFAKKCCALKM